MDKYVNKVLNMIDTKYWECFDEIWQIDRLVSIFNVRGHGEMQIKGSEQSSRKTFMNH